MSDHWYFCSNGEGPFTPGDLVEMLDKKKICGHRDVKNETNGVTTVASVSAVITDALNELYDQTLTPRQRGYLRFLGYDGNVFFNQVECTALIEKLKKQGSKNRQGKSFEECVSEAEKDTKNYERDFLIYYYKNKGRKTVAAANVKPSAAGMFASTFPAERAEIVPDSPQKPATKADEIVGCTMISGCGMILLLIVTALFARCSP